MLRLHRHRHQSKSGEKLDFKFSGFKALQVPKGWDRLGVSFVSAETGKTVAKTSRAAVKNGSCQWADTVSESVPAPEDDSGSSKETNTCVFKLVVSMGSLRSGILGEATLNAMDYASTGDCVPVSLALKKCTHGTTLQVKVQCLTPRAKSRDEESKHKNSDSENPNENNQDIDIKSDGSGSDGVRSSSAKDFRENSNSRELRSRETSFSLSESHQSYDSAEGSTGGEDMSVGDHGESESSRQEFPGSSLTSASLAKNGTAEEEVRAEAKMWERNARKLMFDLDVLKGEFSEVCAERDVLKKDLARDEPRFCKELNDDLALQLKRSHESNAELVSVLRELEETVERQKIEIKDLQQLRESEKILNGKVNEYEARLLDKEEEIAGLKARRYGDDLSQKREIEELKEKFLELERDCNELTEENLELLYKLKQANNEAVRMSTSVEFPNRTSFEFQMSEQQSPADSAEEGSEKKGLKESSVQELQGLIVELEAKLAEMEEENSGLRRCRSEQEALVSDLQKEKAQIQEDMEIVLKESEISSKCLNDLQNDLAVLTSSVDSHSSERKSFDVETRNLELECQVTELETENARLMALVASLEARVESSESRSISLNDEAESLRSEMQSTFDSFILECDFLRKSNGELNNENLGLRKSLLECSRKVDELEGHLSSVVTEFASKEKSLSLEIDALVDENSRQKEKICQEMSLLNQMHIEKVVEAQNLQQEVEHLIGKLSKTHEENERIASDSIEEMARLRADNAKLESLVRAVSEERDGLKTENNELIKKVMSLTTKLLLIDDDLVEIDVLRLRVAELEKEQLQEERESSQRRSSQASEEEKRNPKEQHGTRKALSFSKTNTKVNPVQETGKTTSTRNEMGKSANQRRDHRRNQSQRENGCESPDGSPRDNRADLGSKVELLEDQLAKALEENSKYKVQLNKLMSDTRKVNLEVLKRSATSEGELVSKAKFERTKSTLEAELRDLRERYSSMSLKYAEVEAEREALVMKLKTTPRTSSKSWFS